MQWHINALFRSRTNIRVPFEVTRPNILLSLCFNARDFLAWYCCTLRASAIAKKLIKIFAMRQYEVSSICNLNE